MARSFIDEVNSVLKTPADIEREKAEALKKEQQERYDRELSSLYESIKREILERAQNGKYNTTYHGEKNITFCYLVGTYMGGLPLVDIQISNWSGKHTYVLNSNGEKVYTDLEKRCSIDGIMAQRYLMAFTNQRDRGFFSRFFDWDYYSNAEKGWHTDGVTLKAPCRNGSIHWGQEHEGLVIKITVSL